MVLRHTRNRVVATSLALAGVMLGAGFVVPAIRSTAVTAPPTDGGIDQQGVQVALDQLATISPGALVRVRRGDQTVTLVSGQGSTGTAKVAPKADDKFRIASQTKTFVGVVILQLVAEGKLSLDDSVDKYLPGVVPNGKAIKVRQLMNHTSGIYDYINDALSDEVKRNGDKWSEANVPVLAPYFGKGDWAHQWKPEQLVALGTAKPVLFKPGARYAYSNTGYVLAGMIAEKAAGKPLANEISSRIITPLKLTNTSFPTTDAGISGNHMKGYLVNMPAGHRWPSGTDVTTFSPTVFWGAGAMISNAADLETFYRALMAGSLLKPAQQSELRTLVPDDEDAPAAAEESPTTTTVTVPGSTAPATPPVTPTTRINQTNDPTPTDETEGPAPIDEPASSEPDEQREGAASLGQVATTDAPTTTIPTTNTVPTAPSSSVPPTTEGPEEGYGIGITRVKLSCAAAWGHSGSAFGYSSETLVSEDGKRDVVLAANTNWRTGGTRFMYYFSSVLNAALCNDATPVPEAVAPDVSTTQRLLDQAPAAAATPTGTEAPGADAPPVTDPSVTDPAERTDPSVTDEPESTDPSVPESTDPADQDQPEDR